MAQQPVSWWDQFGEYANRFGPGLLGVGANIFGERAAGRQQQELVRDIRGPQYDTEQALASRSLALASGMDPKAAAAERFAAQQALLAPGEQAQWQDLMRQLQSQGLLGLSSHGAVPGVVSTPGQSMNPYVAAMLAAQQTQRAKSAYESLNEGEKQIDRMIGRSNTLQSGGRAATNAALMAKALAPKPSAIATLLKGGSGLLSSPGAQNAVWDLLKRTGSSLGGLLKGGAGLFTGMLNSSKAPYDLGEPIGANAYFAREYDLGEPIGANAYFARGFDDDEIPYGSFGSLYE